MSRTSDAGKDGIPVIGAGAVTAVGAGVRASCAAARAGISGHARHPYAVDTCGEPYVVARAPWLDADVEGDERLLALLMPAVDECLAPLDGAHARPRLGVALALPSKRPGISGDVDGVLAQRVAERCGSRLARIEIFAAGHAAGFTALAGMSSELGVSIDALVVAGVDSYLAPETLEWLEANDRVHAAGVMNNPWGFVPGEAAGALLLVDAETRRRSGVPAWSVIGACTTAMEPNTIASEAVCLGEGLTAAVRGVMEALPGGEIVDDVVCDMNGEPYRADEYGFMVTRLRDRFAAPSEFAAPAGSWGDVGAASMPLFVALASMAQRKGYARGQQTLAWASSDTGERGAALVRTPREA